MLKFGVRWKTVRCAACFAICGIDWIADDPVPITPTRLPAKSTPSCGHRPVWYVSPSNTSAPSSPGRFGVDKQPVAITQNRHRTRIALARRHQPRR